MVHAAVNEMVGTGRSVMGCGRAWLHGLLECNLGHGKVHMYMYCRYKINGQPIRERLTASY